MLSLSGCGWGQVQALVLYDKKTTEKVQYATIWENTSHKYKLIINIITHLSGCGWGQVQVLGDFDDIEKPLIVQLFSWRAALSLYNQHLQK